MSATKACRTVGEIFASAGEAVFRILEHEALIDVVGKDHKAVVATGGGLPVNPVNRAIMKACGHIVYLRATFENLAERVPKDSGRPLWTEKARSLLLERTPAYEDADTIIDTDGRSAHEVVQELFSLIEHIHRTRVSPYPGQPLPHLYRQGHLQGP